MLFGLPPCVGKIRKPCAEGVLPTRPKIFHARRSNPSYAEATGGRGQRANDLHADVGSKQRRTAGRCLHPPSHGFSEKSPSSFLEIIAMGRLAIARWALRDGGMDDGRGHAMGAWPPSTTSRIARLAPRSRRQSQAARQRHHRPQHPLAVLRQSAKIRAVEGHGP